jgi:hypothetical protein
MLTAAQQPLPCWGPRSQGAASLRAASPAYIIIPQPDPCLHRKLHCQCSPYSTAPSTAWSAGGPGRGQRGAGGVPPRAAGRRGDQRGRVLQAAVGCLGRLCNALKAGGSRARVVPLTKRVAVPPCQCLRPCCPHNQPPPSSFFFYVCSWRCRRRRRCCSSCRPPSSAPGGRRLGPVVNSGSPRGVLRNIAAPLRAQP